MRNKLFYIFMLASLFSNAQGVNNLWTFGYQDSASAPWGTYNLNFSSSSLTFDTIHRKIDMAVTNANISDSNGNLLFCSNGYFVADATGDTMLNGSGLNPSWYTSLYPDGLGIPQANLILKKPTSNSIYYLFHSTVDYPQYSTSLYLYLTTVDMSQNGGLGAVISKNQILISDTLNVGKISAVKHANGRDWWVVCHRAFSDIYYTLLITPDSIFGPFSQHAGTNRSYDGGQVCFSPDGTKFAYFSIVTEMDILDFDRCTGSFSNLIHIAINDTAFGRGVAFSSNSKYLYAPSTYHVYQFDVTAANVAASQTTVAVWDSFYSPPPGPLLSLPALYNLAQLAPDGKIYISTGNSTFHMHVINHPDSAGAACDFLQHGLQLPYYYFNSLPNHPNYFLGRDIGSPCDTLTSSFELKDEMAYLDVKCYPNPSNGLFMLNFPVQSVLGTCEIYNEIGNLIYRDIISQWSQFKQINIINRPNGIYFVKMAWGEKVANLKVIKK